MTELDFLLSLNEVDDTLIQQAAQAGGFMEASNHLKKKKTRKSIWFVAASFALVVLSCATWLLLRKGAIPVKNHAPSGNEQLLGALSMKDTTDTSSEFVWPSEYPYPRAAILDMLEDRGLSLEDYLDMLQHPEKYYMAFEGTPWENDDMDFHGDPVLGQALIALRVGGLYLGQPQTEVLELYGEPTERYDLDYVEKVQNDGTRRDNWFYRFAAEKSMRIAFVDAGDGFVVNEIDIHGVEFEGDRPLGIYVGQPFEEAEAAFRADPVIGPVMYIDDIVYEKAGTQGGGITASLTDLETGVQGWLCFGVYYFDYYIEGQHYVQSIHLGSLYPNPPLEQTIDPEQEEINHRFDSNEITVWLAEVDSWQGQTWQEEETKVIWAQMSVALPEPWDYDGSSPIAVLDFHNDYIVILFDEQEHGGIYRLKDRTAFEQGLAAGNPLCGIELLEYGQFSANTLSTVRDPYKFASDWDFNNAVGAKIKKLIRAVRAKDAEIFTSADGKIILYREKGNFVIAGVFDSGEKITAYARFFADHTLYDNTRNFPMIELDEPAKFLGLDISEIEKTYGKATFEEKLDGETCPSYITRSGYIVILHLGGGKVTAIDLYDHDPTPVTIR